MTEKLIDKRTARGGGPRTPAGKTRSRRNATRHGIFSSELTLSPAEKRALDKMRDGLRNDSQPDSPLRELLFDNMLVTVWQLRKANRALEIAADLLLRESETHPEEQTGGESPMHFPYAWQGLELRRRLKLLQDLRKELDHKEVLSPEWETPVTGAFGPAFWAALADWTPLDLETLWSIHFARATIERCKVYDRELAEPPPTPDEQRQYSAAALLSRLQFARKLIDFQEQHLRLALHQLSKSGDRGAEYDNTGRLDLLLRYVTTARRDFYRALAEYKRASEANSD